MLKLFVLLVIFGICSSFCSSLRCWRSIPNRISLIKYFAQSISNVRENMNLTGSNTGKLPNSRFKSTRKPPSKPLVQYTQQNGEQQSSIPSSQDPGWPYIRREDYFRRMKPKKDAPNIIIPWERIAELDKKDAEWEANRPPSAESINAAAIQTAIQQWKRHTNDTGSAEVQVVVAHEKVKYLTKHLLANKFDNSAKRGLQAIVTLRRKMLNYLYLNGNKEKAMEMAKSLEIRFHPPGHNWDRAVKYAAFKNTKQGKKEKKLSRRK